MPSAKGSMKRFMTSSTQGKSKGETMRKQKFDQRAESLVPTKRRDKTDYLSKLIRVIPSSI